MTLLESLIATVLLAVVSIACLEGTRGAARLQQRNAAMVASLARAESELAGQVVGASVSATPVGAAAPRVRRVPYASDARGVRLEVVEVEISLPSGGTTRLTRLVERAR